MTSESDSILAAGSTTASAAPATTAERHAMILFLGSVFIIPSIVVQDSAAAAMVLDGAAR